MSEQKSVPEKYKKLQKEWKLHESFWSLTHYVVGLSATIFAFLATSKGEQLFCAQLAPETLSGISALLAAIITFLSPASRRKAYTEACNVLRICRMRFETEQDYSVKELNDAVERAQDIIAKR